MTKTVQDRRKQALTAHGILDLQTGTKRKQARKRASIPLSTKATTTSTGEMEIEGYASVFGILDSQGDVIAPGAFDSGEMKERQERGLIKLLSQHIEPIGLPTLLQEDSTGLHFKARISDTALGRDVYTLIKDGVIDRMSIGFDILKYSEFDDDELREGLRERSSKSADLPFWRIERARLWEISPVTFAANDSTSVIAVLSSSLESDQDLSSDTTDQSPDKEASGGDEEEELVEVVELEKSSHSILSLKGWTISPSLPRLLSILSLKRYDPPSIATDPIVVHDYDRIKSLTYSLTTLTRKRISQ